MGSQQAYPTPTFYARVAKRRQRARCVLTTVGTRLKGVRLEAAGRRFAARAVSCRAVVRVCKSRVPRAISGRFLRAQLRSFVSSQRIETVDVMRVFMLGWEFPPFISGGLGTACYGLTKAMSSIGTDIMFVLPRPVSTPFSTHLRLVSPRADSPLASPITEFRLDEFEHVTFRTVGAKLGDPYQSAGEYQQQPQPAPAKVEPQVIRG